MSPSPKRRFRRQDASGNRLHKSVLLKLVKQSGRVWLKRHTAPPGRGFSDKNIDEIVQHFAEFVEKTFPMHECRMLEISRTQFNFICGGERKLPRPPIESFSAVPTKADIDALDAEPAPGL